VGIEEASEIIEDLQKALEKSGRGKSRRKS